MKKKVFLFIVFGCLGISVEVIFTAFSKLITELYSSKLVDFALLGNSYVWMFFIYGIGSIAFPVLYNLINHFHLLFRLLIYAIVIFIIEFLTGFLLDVIMGSCPWKYNGYFAICGYIQLSYVFFWMGFGYMVERIYIFLTGILKNGLQ